MGHTATRSAALLGRARARRHIITGGRRRIAGVGPRPVARSLGPGPTLGARPLGPRPILRAPGRVGIPLRRARRSMGFPRRGLVIILIAASTLLTASLCPQRARAIRALDPAEGPRAWIALASEPTADASPAGNGIEDAGAVGTRGAEKTPLIDTLQRRLEVGHEARAPRQPHRERDQQRLRPREPPPTPSDGLHTPSVPGSAETITPRRKGSSAARRSNAQTPLSPPPR